MIKTQVLCFCVFACLSSCSEQLARLKYNLGVQGGYFHAQSDIILTFSSRKWSFIFDQSASSISALNTMLL